MFLRMHMLVCSLLSSSGVSFHHKDLAVHAFVKFAIGVYKSPTTLKCWECFTLAEQYPMIFFFFAIYRAKCCRRDRCDYLYFSYISPFSAHCFKKYHLYSIIKNISWLIESSTHVQHTTVASTPITFVLKDSQPREQEHGMEMYYEFWFVPERGKIEKSKPNQTCGHP